jgi:2,4-dienoyl-CoA reductase-like NADH-dependent reductase (Old Yellow Enzyme family)
MKTSQSCLETIAQPLTLPCGLVLPNRLVKCPMQETLAELPHFDPPIQKFQELYGTWSRAKYGLLITGQVQVDIRFLSIPGDVVVDRESLKTPIMTKWKEWASIAQAHGTPCLVQLAHPGRMSPKGAGIRPDDMEPICPSSVPVSIGSTWLDKKATVAMLGIPREATHDDIDEVVEAFAVGAQVAQDAGFKGIQIHAAVRSLDLQISMALTR